MEKLTQEMLIEARKGDSAAMKKCVEVMHAEAKALALEMTELFQEHHMAVVAAAVVLVNESVKGASPENYAMTKLLMSLTTNLGDIPSIAKKEFTHV